MIRTAMGPLLAELRSMDCAALERRLGLNAEELRNRTNGVVEFDAEELMVVARWLGRPMSAVFAAFDGLFRTPDKGADTGVEGFGDLP